MPELHPPLERFRFSACYRTLLCHYPGQASGLSRFSDTDDCHSGFTHWP